MAQWLRQFSGNTHQTAVLDAEGLLKRAVQAFVDASPVEKPEKLKSVRALTKRLYTVRVRFLKAQLSAAADPACDTVLAARSHEIAKLEQALSLLTAGGMAQILKEFSVPNDAG